MIPPELTSGRFTWQRVWRHPNARIQPLDSRTVYQANRARLWIGGQVTATLQRLGGGWELRLCDQPEALASRGSTALEAISNFLSSSEEYQS